MTRQPVLHIVKTCFLEKHRKILIETESQTKNEVMALISKSYALFYMQPENQHPNIPSKSTYNAVDNPNIFQKYV